MNGHELPVGSLPAAPSFVPREVVKSARQDYSIDQQLIFRRLEFMCKSLGAFEQPRLYEGYDSENFRSHKVLTVPLESDNRPAKSLFVAVNTETSALGEDDYERRSIVMSAFRLALRDRRVARTDETVVTRPSHQSYWPLANVRGPYICRSGTFLDVQRWKPTDLLIDSEPARRLSVASMEEMVVAEQLMGVLNGLSPANEVPDVTLFYDEL